MALLAEHALLYSLRSRTTPLADKVAAASSALDTAPGNISLAATVRDWTVDALLRATRQQAAVAGTSAILDAGLWELAARTTEATLSTSPVAASTLPVFVAFTTQYSHSAPNVRLLRCATSVWTRLATNALRKATADVSLDGYEKLLEAILRAFSRDEMAETDEERKVWTELAVNWLKPFRSVVLEAGKGGKKIPSHALGLLPTLLPLLSRLSLTSPLRTSLLQTLQHAIFNLENLRRGLARDSYTTGGTSSASQPPPSTADSELLAALASLPSAVTLSAYDALPSLTQIYFAAVAAHAETLFPLPAKATFATPSAQKSAREVLGLRKRREMAGRWIRGVVDLLGWAKEAEAMEMDGAGLEEAKSAALAGSLAIVEQGDLYRSGQAGEGWHTVLPDIVTGAISRLGRHVGSSEHEATFTILRTISNLDHDILEPALLRILAVLARTPDPSASTPELDAFLRHLIEHHSRSVTLPTLLTHIADALASSASSTLHDSVLTSHAFLSQLGTAIAGIVGGPNAVGAAWQSIIDPVVDALQPSEMAEAAGNATDAPSPAKKRKLSSATPSSALPAAARLRVADVLVRNAPASSLPLLLEPLRIFVDEVVDPHLNNFGKASLGGSSAGEVGEESKTPRKMAKKSSRRKSGTAFAADAGQVDPTTRLGAELLQLRYTVVSRLVSEGLLSTAESGQETSRWWELKAKRRDLLREVVEKGVPEVAVVSTNVLLQQLELLSDVDEVEIVGIVQAVLSRVKSVASSEEASWSGRQRGLRAEEAGIAIWEVLSRRWMTLMNTIASEEQLRQVASIVLFSLRRMSRPTDSAWSASAIMARLLRRADFWELTRLQACLSPALRDLVSLPSLSSATDVLAALALHADKASKALRSLAPATLLETVDVFSAISTSVPVEYLNKETRRQLADRALALDLWVSSGEAAVPVDAKARSQQILRHFVASLGVQASISSEVAQHLLNATLPAALDETLAFYRTLVVEPALTSLKQNQQADDLKRVLESFDGLEVGKHAAVAAPQEEAFFALLDSLVATVPDTKTFPRDFLDILIRLVNQAKRRIDTFLPTSSVVVQKNAASLARVLVAYRSIWATQHWLKEGKEGTEATTEFVHAVAASVVARVVSTSSEQVPLCTSVATVRLLALHAEILRSSASADKLDTRRFEMLLACHLALRQTVDAADAADLDTELAFATAAATVEEYSAGLQAVAEALAIDTGRSFEHMLQVAKVLLLAGPQGSSRMAASTLSDILRQLLLLVERCAANGSGGLELFLPVASFVESICGERPLLLSRLNTSSILSLVSLILRPSPKSSSTAHPLSHASTVSEVFLNLAATVGHIVRHRKDHLVALFPSLTSVLSAFLSTLRRAGAGTLGSALEGEDETASVVVGHRAEREAKASFPVWVWDGGREAIGRNEARAVGRLLGSLTAKTTTTTASKRKSAISSGQTDDASANTSLGAPLSKHAPFLLLNYLRACVHPTCPIPSALRAELQGGWIEILDAMGKWEREALMKGLLGEDEEAERGVLRNLWKSWEKERYKG